MIIDFSGMTDSTNVIIGGLITFLGAIVVGVTTLSTMKAYISYSMKDEEEQSQRPFSKIAVQKFIAFVSLGICLIVIGFIQIVG